MALTSLRAFLHQPKLRMIRSRLQVLIISNLVCNLNKQTTATPGVSTHASQFWSQDGGSRKDSASPAAQTGWKGGGATRPHTPEPAKEPAVPKHSPPRRRSLCASLATPAATLSGRLHLRPDVIPRNLARARALQFTRAFIFIIPLLFSRLEGWERTKSRG